MDIGAGPYSFTLPERDDISVRPPRRHSFGPDPLARLGPYEFHALLSRATLEEMKEHIGWTTKYEAKFATVEFNGVPGFIQIDTTGAACRRIDYVFQAPGLELVSIVATSDIPASETQQELVHEVVRTINVGGRPFLMTEVADGCR